MAVWAATCAERAVLAAVLELRRAFQGAGPEHLNDAGDIAPEDMGAAEKSDLGSARPVEGTGPVFWMVAEDAAPGGLMAAGPRAVEPKAVGGAVLEDLNAVAPEPF